MPVVGFPVSMNRLASFIQSKQNPHLYTGTDTLDLCSHILQVSLASSSVFSAHSSHKLSSLTLTEESSHSSHLLYISSQESHTSELDRKSTRLNSSHSQ